MLETGYYKTTDKLRQTDNFLRSLTGYCTCISIPFIRILSVDNIFNFFLLKKIHSVTFFSVLLLSAGSQLTTVKMEKQERETQLPQFMTMQLLNPLWSWLLHSVLTAVPSISNLELYHFLSQFNVQLGIQINFPCARPILTVPFCFLVKYTM